MSVKLHRHKFPHKGFKHPCWNVERALIEAGIEHEVVFHPALPRSRRTQIIAATGQALMPVIELEDGRWLREDSADLVARINAGRLFEP